MKKLNIIVGLTGSDSRECQRKIAAAARLRLPVVALFLERLDPEERCRVYAALEKSGLKNIPLVHIRLDMSREELVMLSQKYKTKYFTIHEDHFAVIKKWRGFYRNLYLEMTTDDYVAANVKVEQIGGFCVDLAHYKRQLMAATKDFAYVYDHRRNRRLFVCNHLNGYDPKTNLDVHRLRSKKDLSFLKDLPHFLFGRVIALEMDNPIKQQLAYRDYIWSLLAK